jgi:protein-S-isoprenylcysteine O-methyltransferase Ste14
MRDESQAFLIVPAVVITLLTALGLLGHAAATAVGLPPRLAIAPGLRAAGAILLLAGFGLLFWIFRHRSVRDVIVSTFATMRKSAGRSDPAEAGGRSEPLVTSGPQQLVRHPLYAVVPFLMLGWWLVLDYTFLLFTAVLLSLWFRIVVIPIEERELRALFGSAYDDYASRTPRLVPKPRIRGRHRGRPAE